MYLPTDGCDCRTCAQELSAKAMKGKTLVIVVSCGLLYWDAGLSADKTTNSGALLKADAKVPAVRTIFEKGASLTPRELGQALVLAKECGISEPGEVSTMYFIPGGGKGIHVKSTERISGRDIAVDELTIGKAGWTEMTPGKDAKRVGKLWAVPSDKYTRHLRVYDFRGERIRVQMSGGISAELADKVMALIAARQVRFRAKDGVWNFDQEEMEKMLAAKPTALTKQGDGAFWLHVEGTLNALQMRYEKGEVVLEHVILINV